MSPKGSGPRSDKIVFRDHLFGVMLQIGIRNTPLEVDTNYPKPIGQVNAR